MPATPDRPGGVGPRSWRPRRHAGLTFMEVCGTHTMAIARYGLRDAAPRPAPGLRAGLSRLRHRHQRPRPCRRARPAARGDAGHLRRPPARARLAQQPGGRTRRRRRRARRLLAARRRRDGGRGARTPGRLRRHRLRDDGAHRRRRILEARQRGVGTSPCSACTRRCRRRCGRCSTSARRPSTGFSCPAT